MAARYGNLLDSSDLAPALLLTLLALVSLANTFVYPTGSWPQYVLYLVFPALVMLVGLPAPPQAYGLSLGNREMLKLSLLGSLVLLAVPLAAIAMPEFQSYYRRPELYGNLAAIVWAELQVLPLLLASEFFFRGFSTFGLARFFGKNAAFIQAIPFAFLHLGKPWLEILASYFGGAFFALVCLRARSFLPALIMHFVVHFEIVLLANYPLA